MTDAEPAGRQQLMDSIMELRELGWTYKQIAQSRGVSRQAIWEFINRKPKVRKAHYAQWKGRPRPGPSLPPQIDAIQKTVAAQLAIPQAQLREKSNLREVVFPRQIAMYVVRELTDASLPQIGRAFGGKHHTTVFYSIQKIGEERQINPTLDGLIQRLMVSCRALEAL